MVLVITEGANNVQKASVENLKRQTIIVFNAASFIQSMLIYYVTRTAIYILLSITLENSQISLISRYQKRMIILIKKKRKEILQC